jgi:lipoyl(octanoyl) transferase
MKALASLWLWLDPVERPGPEAMAVDEWLLETSTAPVLRVYQWRGEWGSVGYFGCLADARASFPDINWVRRWTGGGTVDHRADWTYSVIVPAGLELARARGAQSYHRIHSALAEALRLEGMEVKLSGGEDSTGAASCFENPVRHDLIEPDGRKLAGAGQRRTSLGLLHQGSVSSSCDSELRAHRLASCLADSCEMGDFSPPAEIIAAKVIARYGLDAWTLRR